MRALWRAAAGDLRGRRLQTVPVRARGRGRRRRHHRGPRAAAQRGRALGRRVRARERRPRRALRRRSRAAAGAGRPAGRAGGGAVPCHARHARPRGRPRSTTSRSAPRAGAARRSGPRCCSAAGGWRAAIRDEVVLSRSFALDEGIEPGDASACGGRGGSRDVAGRGTSRSTSSTASIRSASRSWRGQARGGRPPRRAHRGARARCCWRASRTPTRSGRSRRVRRRRSGEACGTSRTGRTRAGTRSG